MILCETLDKIPALSEPIGLSIGTFDGLHLGHQSLFRLLRQKVGPHGSVAALTFTNHPSQLLGHIPIPLLCTLEHKLKLLQQLSIDLVILIEFTVEFAQKPFDLFLKELKKKLPFTFLALGEEASFGKDRQGKPSAIKALAPILHFEVDYAAKTLWKDQPISSGRIRKALQEGDLAEVSSLLGRPYSILAPLSPLATGCGIDATHLCLPPDGTYSVRLRLPNKTLQTTATVSNKEQTIHLELNTSELLASDQQVEILF